MKGEKLSFLSPGGVHRLVCLSKGLLILGVVLFASCDKSTYDDSRPHIPTPVRQTVIDRDGAWSPDGSKIIYFRHFSERQDTQWVWGVFLYDLTSGRDSLLWPYFQAFDLTWSPDGKKVAFSHGAQIYIRDLDSSNMTQITSGERCFGSRWSPCGDKLMYFIRETVKGMYLYNLDWGTAFHFGGNANSGDWLPGCTTVVLTDFLDHYDEDIVIRSLSSGTRKVLRYVPGFKRAVTGDPTGTQFILSADPYLWKVGTDMTEPQRLTTEGGGFPDWSPDGKWIVYTKVDSLNGHLWLMRPDGSERHQITF